MATRRCHPDYFRHLVNEETGLVTILGFGSLVSRDSAIQSFEFVNFRLGTIRGFRRVFNRADWINISWGDACVETGEVCSVALMQSCDGAMGGEKEPVKVRVSLMDVTAKEGLSGFLERESTYKILEVLFVDDNGVAGVALACGECSDEESMSLWGRNNWYFAHCTGRISYVGDAVPNDPMPLVPFRAPVGESGREEERSYPSCLTPRVRRDVYKLPSGPWVYPSPGYLRLVYRAHKRAGVDVAENFLDTTLLMDRKTTVRAYLDANAGLKEYVVDAEMHQDWASDRYG